MDGILKGLEFAGQGCLILTALFFIALIWAILKDSQNNRGK